MPITLRPLQSSDLALLAHWLSRPHVQRWWREPADIETVEARYGPMIGGSDPTDGFIVLNDGQPIGFAQRYLLEDNPDWQSTVSVGVGPVCAAGIDYLIGIQSATGRGLGPRVIEALVADCWRTYPEIRGGCRGCAAGESGLVAGTRARRVPSGLGGDARVRGPER